MSLLTDWNDSQNTDFQYKVAVALTSTAIAVQAEAANTANHAARSAYALKVLADPRGYAALMAPGFTADGSVAIASATDTDIKNRASAVWNAYCVQS